MDRAAVRNLAVATTVLFLLPWVLALCVHFGGGFPAGWGELNGNNHGPWRWEVQGFTIAYPLLALAVWTAIRAGYQLAVRRPKAWIGLAFSPVQICLGMFQLRHLIWLID